MKSVSHEVTRSQILSLHPQNSIYVLLLSLHRQRPHGNVRDFNRSQDLAVLKDKEEEPKNHMLQSCWSRNTDVRVVRLICTHKVFEDLACLSAVGRSSLRQTRLCFRAGLIKNANGRPMILAENRKSDIRNKLRQESIGKKCLGQTTPLVAQEGDPGIWGNIADFLGVGKWHFPAQ